MEKKRKRAKNPKESAVYNIDTVAKRLSLGINAAYAAARAGQIPGAMRIGGRVIVVKRIFDRAMGVES